MVISGLATGNGLARFDGVRFDVFDSVRVPEALTAPEFFCLLESPDGTFWIGSYWGGLIAYKDGRFRKFGKAEGLTDERVVSIERDRNGFLWLGTPDGLFRMKDGKFKRYWKEDGLPGRVVWAIEEDHNGKLWLATVGGGLYQRQNERFVRYTAVDTVDILSLHVDRKNNLWVGTDEGLFRIQNDNVSRFTKKDGLASGVVRAIVEDHDGNIWIGETTGLSRLHNGTIHNITKDQGFAQAVRCLFVDREGTLWVGTSGGGLFSFRDGKVITFSTEEGLTGEMVNYVHANPQGDIWLATNAGINRIRKQGSAYAVDSVPTDNPVLSILEDSNKNVLAGIEDQGLFLLRNLRLEQHSEGKKLLSNLPWALLEERPGDIWIAYFGHGISRITNGSFNGSFSLKTGLPSSYVFGLVSDGDHLLASTEDAGILRFENGKFSTYISQEDLEHQAWTFFYDDEKVLWIATLGGGLKRFKNGKLKTIRRKDGLIDDTVGYILQDDHGNFWMNCQKGIFSVPKKQMNDLADGKISQIQCSLYTNSDGMKASETNQSGWKTPDGKLWLATTKGVVMVDPDHLIKNSLPPPVHIERLFVDDQSFDQRSASNVKLKPGSEKIEFHYTALSFADPAKMRFKYKLEGFDHEWVDAGTRRVAYYTNISPGSYNFRVLASNNDDVWNEAGASLNFYVKPHFYQTTWFYFICIAAVFGAAMGLHRQKMRKASKEFVAVLSERSRIAREIHDGLTQGLAGVVMQLETVRLLPAGDQAEKHLDRALELARKSVEDARRTIEFCAHNHFPQLIFRRE